MSRSTRSVGFLTIENGCRSAGPAARLDQFGAQVKNKKPRIVSGALLARTRSAGLHEEPVAGELASGHVEGKTIDSGHVHVRIAILVARGRHDQPAMVCVAGPIERE